MTIPNAAPAGWRKPLRIMLYVALPTAAIAFAYIATRKPASQAPKVPKAAVHDHSQMAAADAPKTVMISATDANRIGVTYAEVTSGTQPREIRAAGQITFDETRVKMVTSKIDGWVEQLFVNATGQSVAVGAPLYAMYSPMLVSAQEELLLAKRLEADVASGAPDARVNAASLIQSSRNRLALWDVSADDIAQLEREGHARRSLVQRSQVSGFVIEKNLSQGQRIMAGDALYKVADLSTVWLEGEVYEQDLPSVKLGQRVMAELQAIPGTTFTGRLAYIYPTLNPETRTVRVRVEMPNINQRLKPGMAATLRLNATAVGSVLTVPRTAVLSTGERHLVFVKRNDGMLEPRDIEIGYSSSDRIEVLRGLARGEIVVASATFLVDAESNLGAALGGMGNMPGMDIAAPKKKQE